MKLQLLFVFVGIVSTAAVRKGEDLRSEQGPPPRDPSAREPDRGGFEALHHGEPRSPYKGGVLLLQA